MSLTPKSKVFIKGLLVMSKLVTVHSLHDSTNSKLTVEICIVI